MRTKRIWGACALQDSSHSQSSPTIVKKDKIEVNQTPSPTTAVRHPRHRNMGRSLVFSANIPLKFSQEPNLVWPLHRKLCQSFPRETRQNSLGGSLKFPSLNANRGRTLCVRAVVSSDTSYPKVGAASTGPIPPGQLIEVVETAATTGAQVFYAHSVYEHLFFPIVDEIERKRK